MIRHMVKSSLLLIFAVLVQSNAGAQEADEVLHFKTPDDYTAGSADLESLEIEVEKLSDTLYSLSGVPDYGNLLVSIGESGVLLVDDDAKGNIPKIQAKINQLGGGDVDFVINTHWHFDHSDGNLALGPAGAWIVAQAKSREMMLGDHQIYMPYEFKLDQQAYEGAALPTLTFDNSMQFHFNGERIDLLHFGPAHTTGDAAVYFRNHNIIHMGDVFNNSSFPFIDADNGGSLQGMINFCKQVLNGMERDTKVFPGHGTVVGYEGFEDYITMLETLRDRIQAMIDNGATLAQIQQANVAEEYGFANAGEFVNRAYTSLIK